MVRTGSSINMIYSKVVIPRDLTFSSYSPSRNSDRARVISSSSPSISRSKLYSFARSSFMGSFERYSGGSGTFDGSEGETEGSGVSGSEDGTSDEAPG